MKRAMNRWIALVLLAALAAWQLPAQAQARVYNQAELDALLAPVALYPDDVLSNVLVAASYPEDVRQAAEWSRANAQLAGEDAVRAAQPMPWHPSVKALVAFPDLLARMDESAPWTADLGAAFREQEPYVMDTVQRLRRRAQANGSLQSNDQYMVQQQGPDLAVYPAQPQVVYVPYYDPYVVYGTWWWPAYRPVFWRPWYPRPAVFASTTFAVRSVDWRARHVVHPGFHGQVVRQAARIVQPQPVIQSHTPAQPYIQSRGQPYIQNHTAPARPIVDASRPRPQPWGQRVEQGREVRREPPRAAPQAPVAIPQQQAMRSIAATVRNQPPQPNQSQIMRSIGATVRNQAQQTPQMRAPLGHAPQGATRTQSSGGNHQRRG
jgi:Protein of unknown function (DUF3300)